jgi:hypothetical protein
MRFRGVVLGLLLTASAASPAAARPDVPHHKVVLQTLDKVTARIGSLEATLDEPVRLGTLEITLRACLTTPPIEAPESAAFLEIRDVEQNGSRTLVFEGWMFASSPGLSALEHPVYDVWVLRCEAPMEPEQPAPPEEPVAPGEGG